MRANLFENAQALREPQNASVQHGHCPELKRGTSGSSCQPLKRLDHVDLQGMRVLSLQFHRRRCLALCRDDDIRTSVSYPSRG